MKKEFPPFKELIKEINRYYSNLLGYSIEETELKGLNQKQWNSFCTKYKLHNNSRGIYLPRIQTAIIPQNNRLSLFHEYFGHGLFCEQSLMGKTLVNLEKKLLEEEKQKFREEQFTLKDIEEFRERNETFQLLKNLQEENTSLYEGFAIWTEYLLSREFGLIDSFEEKYDSLSKQDEEQIESLISFNKQHGNLATFYNFGLARRTTPERVRELLKGIYKEKLKDAKLAILYGSRKEFSDIDVFIVSDDLPEVDCPWLDVRVEKEKDFEKMIKMFDVSIIDPISMGEFLVGDREYLEQKKKTIRRATNHKRSN